MTTDLLPSFGKYDQVQRLGEGGFGEVYRAVDTTLNRPVALKVPHRELLHDPGFVAQFRAEAQTSAQLDHPNIVRIYSVGDVEGTPFIEMELVEGQTLAELIKAQGRLTPEQALAIVEPVCAALGEAHGKGIIHRDVKPGNILIRKSDGRVLVTDFGLAKTRENSFQASLSSSNVVVGTFRYMPPEQANRRLGDVGPRSDIYSLGVVLYEMLTGRAPFDSKSVGQLIYEHTSEPPEPPSNINVGLSAAVESVVLKALAKLPEERFASAQDVALALRAAVERGVPATPLTRPAAAKLPPAGQPATTAAPPTSTATRSTKTAAQPTSTAPSSTAQAPRPAAPTRQSRSRAPIFAFIAVAVVAVGLIWALVGGPADQHATGIVTPGSRAASPTPALAARAALVATEPARRNASPAPVGAVAATSTIAAKHTSSPTLSPTASRTATYTSTRTHTPSATPTPTRTPSPTLINTPPAAVVEDNSASAAAMALQPMPTVTPRPALLSLNPGDYERPTSTVLEGRIGEDTMLSRTSSPYTVRGNVVIEQNVTLFIEAGAVIKFAENAQFSVYGALRAQGTTDNRIVFTSLRDDSYGGDTNGDGESSVPAAGDWTYIGFFDSSNDANSIIQNSVIRYAGEHNGNRFGAIYLESASPSIVDNEISDCFSYAISGDVNSFPTVRANQLIRNAGNGLEMRGGSVTASGAWANTGVAYAVTGIINVNENTTLSIYPGVTVKFGDNIYIDVYGTLKAQGLPEQPITLTSLKDDLAGGDTNGDGESSVAAPRDWTMIRFRDQSNDANSVVAYCDIRYAGEHNGNQYGAVHLESASPRIIGNSFSNNHWFAISADPNSFPKVSGNRMEKNGGNGLEVRGGELYVSGKWENTDITYAVTGVLTVRDGATLGIGPGVIAKFDDNTFIDVYGALRAVGSPDSRITLTSLKDDAAGGDTNGDEGSSAPGPGDWTMVRFRDASNDASSMIRHTSIQYAGEHNGNRFGAVHLEAASPTIADSSFRNNLAYAISADVSSFPTVSGNETADNTGNGLEIRGGGMAASGAWVNTDIAYAVTSQVTINEGATLRVGPGVVVKLAGDTFVDIYGTLRAEGTADRRTIFTSIKDDAAIGDTNGDGESSAPAAGDWTMLRFRDSSNDASSKVTYTEIRYAGRHSGDRYGAIHLESAAPTITNNRFRENYWYAISGDVKSFPIANGNELSRNGGNGLEVRGGEMSSASVWSNKDIVYAVTGSVVVQNNATLNLEPGVIVKLAENTYIDVYGALKAVGTASQKVIFTSLRDDSTGGDTNGDGRSSTAAAGDWTMIRFYDDSNDGACIIDNATIRYAGQHGGNPYGAIHVLSASPTVQNTLITDTFACAVWYDKGSSPRLAGNIYADNAEGTVCQPK